MTFKEFLAARPYSDDLVGDFVKHARRDPNLPVLERLEEIQNYVTESRLPRGAQAAAHYVRAEYLDA